MKIGFKMLTSVESIFLVLWRKKEVFMRVIVHGLSQELNYATEH